MATKTKQKKRAMPKRKRKNEDEGNVRGDVVKYKGVGTDGRNGSGRYQAYINTDGKQQGLGTFGTPKEAAIAHDLAAIQAGRPTSKLNFLDQVPQNYEPKKKRSFLTKFPRTTINRKIKKNYKGVGKQKSGRYQAYIVIDGKKQPLGTFDTSKEAAQAYDFAAIQAGRPTFKLNFLNQVPKIYNPKKKKLNPRNTSGYRGVAKKGNRFVAQITIDGRSQHIGMYGTAKEAADAYDQAATQAAIQAKPPKFPRYKK